MIIGLCANLRKDFHFDPNGPPDQSADWDIEETIIHMRSALERLQHTVKFLDPKQVLGCQEKHSIDFVLSICEMTGGPFRESLVPALCEIEGVPYFFSTPDSLHNTLDKNLANLLIRQTDVQVPPWINLEATSEFDRDRLAHLSGPFIVKPTAEGSGMGMSDPKALATTPDEAIIRASELQKMYRGDVLIQEFSNGREFTIGVIDKEIGSEALWPIEISPKMPNEVFIYNYHSKENSSDLVSFTPLKDEAALAIELRAAAVKVHSKLKCRDVSRIDFRYDGYGRLNFIEVNALPHFHPEIGDFCRSASAHGYEYDQMWDEIVRSAQRRYFN